jgi:4-hydroxybenzoyl-CoA reductase subunit beta
MDGVKAFTLCTPHTVAEAATMLGSTLGARAVAGGTDMIPGLRRGLRAAPKLVDLSGIPELRTLSLAPSGVTIGAGVTLARLATSEDLRRALPIVAEAAASVAGPAHRSVATLGGNLCLDTRCVFYNQSEWWRRANDFCLKHGGETCHVAPQGRHCHAAFSGDLAPALLVLGAGINVAGPRSVRRERLASLYADDGAAHLTLGAGEILVAVTIPPQPREARSGYRKARARGAIDYPLAGVAARLELRNGRIAGLRVALTGTNSRPFLLEGTDDFADRAIDEVLLAKLAKLVQKQAGPMRTTVTQSNYRRQVAAVLAQRLVRELAGDEERRVPR